MKIINRGFIVEIEPATGFCAGLWLCNPHKITLERSSKEFLSIPMNPTEYLSNAGYWHTEAEAQKAYDEWIALGGKEKFRKECQKLWR